MRYVVATRSGKLNVRSGPGLNHAVTSRLAKGSIVDVVESRNGWSRVSGRGWASTQYLSPQTATGSGAAAWAPVDPPTATHQQIASAERKLTTYIRWHNPPQRGAGMGGIFPGEGLGRVNYPYLNWLSAYYHTAEAYLRGEPQHRARQAWPDYCRRRGMLVEQGGRNGTLKADNVWFQIPNRVREGIVEDYQQSGDVYHRVTTALRAHLQSEMRRLMTPSDYGALAWLLGTQ